MSRFPIFLIFSLIILNISCSEYSEQRVSSPTPTASTKNQLLNFAIETTRNHAQSLSRATEQFQKQLSLYCQNLQNNNEDDRDIKLSYERLIQSYYKLNGLPIANMKEDHNPSLLSEIYYPTLNRCLVDVQTLNTKENIKASPVSHPSVQGLLAIEYLLFDKQLESKCNAKQYPQITTWNQLSNLEKKQDRCQQAIQFSEILVQKTKNIAVSWTEGREDYNKNLQLFAITQSDNAAIKNMMDGLNSLEKIKDYYLGKPLALNSLCTSDTGSCPNDIPHPYSETGLIAVTSALLSFQNLFEGQNATDFSLKKYLISEGQIKMVSQMTEALNTAIAFSEKLQRLHTLNFYVLNLNPENCRLTTLHDPREPICLLYLQIQNVTSIYKREILTFMSIESNSSLPQGDSD